MKRDMDLVRMLLIRTEETEKPLTAHSFLDDDWSLEEIAYHVELLANHGLLDATAKRGGSGRPMEIFINGLTWDGCDYLDAIRDSKTWEKTKKVVKETVGSVTLEVLKEVASLIALQTIKASLGIQ